MAQLRPCPHYIEGVALSPSPCVIRFPPIGNSNSECSHVISHHPVRHVNTVYILSPNLTGIGTGLGFLIIKKCPVILK